MLAHAFLCSFPLTPLLLTLVLFFARALFIGIFPFGLLLLYLFAALPLFCALLFVLPCKQWRLFALFFPLAQGQRFFGRNKCLVSLLLSCFCLFLLFRLAAYNNHQRDVDKMCGISAPCRY